MNMNDSRIKSEKQVGHLPSDRSKDESQTAQLNDNYIEDNVRNVEKVQKRYTCTLSVVGLSSSSELLWC